MNKKVFDVLSIVRRMSKDPKLFKSQQPMILKSITSLNPPLQSFEAFCIYNKCSDSPQLTSKVLSRLEPQLSDNPKNWIVLFKKIKVMLLNNQNNQQLINRFIQYITMTQLSNVQILSLGEILNFLKSKNENKSLKNIVNQVLQDAVHELSSDELKILVSNFSQKYGSIQPLSQQLSKEIQNSLQENLEKFKEKQFLEIQIFINKNICFKSDNNLFRKLVAYRYFQRMRQAFQISQSKQSKSLISSLLGPTRIQAERTPLQSQRVQTSVQRKNYYERVKSNPLFQYPSIELYRGLQAKIIKDIGNISYILQTQNSQMILNLLQDHYQLVSDETFVNYLFNILRNDHFVNFQKYPKLKNALMGKLDHIIVFSMSNLNKLMHILTAYTLQYPEFLMYLQKLDKAFQQKKTQLDSVPKDKKLSLLKLIGIEQTFVKSMPFLAEYLLKQFQYNISKRQLMFLNKLQYLMGKTSLLPENTFQFSRMKNARSFLQDRIASFVKEYPFLNLRKGVYYKGYEIDLLISNKDIKDPIMVYIDICGSKHFYKNQYRFRPNTQSKVKFLKNFINYEVIYPDPLKHTNKKQLDAIIRKYFSSKSKTLTNQN